MLSVRGATEAARPSVIAPVAASAQEHRAEEGLQPPHGCRACQIFCVPEVMRG